MSEADGRALTTWLAESAATATGAEVVTSADVKQLMELQGQKQMAGCDDSIDACVAELATALGAELVVRAELSSIDGALSLNVTVLNSSTLGSTKRALWQAPTTTALRDEVRRGLPGLIAGARGAGDAVRVFVVDVVVRDVDSPPPAPQAEEGANVLVPVGGVIVGAGALGLAVAGVAEFIVAGLNADLSQTGQTALDQPAAADAVAARGQWALVGQVAWVAGGIAAVAGGAVLAAGLVGGE